MLSIQDLKGFISMWKLVNSHALSLKELWLDLNLLVSTDVRLSSDLLQRFLNNSLSFLNKW